MDEISAVQWLVEKYNIVCGLGSSELMKEHIERAKEMHREQTTKAYREGRTDEQTTIARWYNRTAAEYYNETYCKK